MVMFFFFLTSFSLKSSYFNKMLYWFENEYSREKKYFKMSNLSMIYTYAQLASTDFIVTICEHSI